MNPNADANKDLIKSQSAKFSAAKAEIGKTIVGQAEMVKALFIALLADGHLLLEGLPGLAKTLAVNTFAKVLQCDFKRIQFTPDLLPADLIGTSIYNPKEGTFSINKGPIFTQILLADEINRASPKTQSALLEAMQEFSVTVRGHHHKIERPFFVLATQNPVEQEGTYPLPEAQLDRFAMKLRVGYPSREHELAMLGAVICAVAVMARSFWGLCLGTFFIGCYNATGGFYRFAAADAVTGPDKARAISLVLAGGIVGGLIGPESSKLTKDWLSVTYAGTYLSLVAFAIVAMAVQSQLKLPALGIDKSDEPARPLGEIARQPKFIVAALSAALGYGVMNLLMVATPLAMNFCGHPFKEGVFVLEWHVVGMFAPSFFTGNLIKRFGALQIIIVGCLLNFVTLGIDLSGTTVAHFWFGLFVLGVGWNFMFIGGTALLTETYRPSEKTRVQGFNDMLVFGTMAVSSSSAGVLVNARGWEIVNYTAAPFIGFALIAALWLAIRSRRSDAGV